MTDTTPAPGDLKARLQQSFCATGFVAMGHSEDLAELAMEVIDEHFAALSALPAASEGMRVAPERFVGERVEWQDSPGRWHPGVIVGRRLPQDILPAAEYEVRLDDGTRLGWYAAARFRDCYTTPAPVAASGEGDALLRMFRAIVDAGGPETIARHGVERGSDAWTASVRAGILAIERRFYPERFALDEPFTTPPPAAKQCKCDVFDSCELCFVDTPPAAVGAQGDEYKNTADVPDPELREQLSACREDWQRLCDVIEPGQHFDPDDLIRRFTAALTASPAAGRGDGMVLVPREPSDGLLMSMAIRFDHGLGVPGYYDTLPIQFGVSHEQRLRSTLTTMRQLHEEVVGAGFYSADREASYTAFTAASDAGEGKNG